MEEKVCSSITKKFQIRKVGSGFDIYLQQLQFYNNIPPPDSKKPPQKHLYLTDGTKEAFPGLGMFFLRTIVKAITPSNIAQVKKYKWLLPCYSFVMYV